MKDMNPVEILERALTEAGQAMDDSICEAIDILRGPEPDWGEAPEWAQWWAVDALGDSTWFGTKPIFSGMAWQFPHDAKGSDCSFWSAGRITLPLGTDWRLTLRKRPEEL